MKLKNINWENRLSKALFVLIVIYGIISIYVLFWGKIGIIPTLQGVDEDVKWITYSIISFALVIIISIYHLGLPLLRRRKK